jgi:hypothetical protein
MKIPRSIQVNYQSTNDPNTAKQWLENLPDLIAADLETAIRYTDNEIQEAKEKMNEESLPKKERIRYQAIAKATALGHPYHCTITHVNIAGSEEDAYVFIIDNKDIADVVLQFLVTTKKKQIWHNYCYDGRFMRYYADADPVDIEDTQILAKTLINHVETFKARTGLKELAGQWYGDWGIDAENFTLAQQYDEKVLRYSAIDACATFKLWHYLQEFIQNNPLKEEAHE